MSLFLQNSVASDITIWRDILLPIIYVAGVVYGSIILSKQVTALKEQVNSQREIIDRTKTYFEIFDLNKIKEYAKLTEENEKLKSERKLNELNILIKEKEDIAFNLQKVNTVMENELEYKKERFEQILNGMEVRMRDVEARGKFPNFFQVPSNSSWGKGIGTTLGKGLQDSICKFIDDKYPVINEYFHLSQNFAQETWKQLELYLSENNLAHLEILSLDENHNESPDVLHQNKLIIEKWINDYAKIRKIISPDKYE